MEVKVGSYGGLRTDITYGLQKNCQTHLELQENIMSDVKYDERC